MKIWPSGLYAIVDDSLTPQNKLVSLGISLARAGASCVQLRIKKFSDREFLKIAEELNRAISPTPLVINDRPDICILCKAKGLHLGQSDIPPSEARKIVGSAVVIGLSCNTLKDVERANSEPVDHIAFGPIYETKTKKNAGPVVGIESLKRAVQVARFPVVAIGGINDKNLHLISRSGARAFAVISYLAKSKNPELAAKKLIDTWKRK